MNSLTESDREGARSSVLNVEDLRIRLQVYQAMNVPHPKWIGFNVVFNCENCYEIRFSRN